MRVEQTNQPIAPAALTVLLVATLAASVSLFGVGCSGEPESSPKPDKAQPAAASSPAQAPSAAAASGAVAGSVAFVGEAPAPRSVRMAADPYCANANPGGAKSGALVVGDGGGLAGVFVYVKSGVSGSFTPPNVPVVINQRGCQYSPKLVGVQTGQPLEIGNADSTLHNVHALPQNSRGFNLAMPKAGMKSTKKFAKPEVLVRIKCDVHPWMETFVGVVDHPFFAITGADGKFRIDGLAPGSYEIEAVHPKLGRHSQAVNVASKEEAAVSFSFERAK